MNKETQTLIRLCRYFLNRIAEREADGYDASAYRGAFHMTVKVLHRLIFGKMGREDLKPLIDLLDKSSIGSRITGIETDGGPGSGNHGHKGVPGQRGGSAPGASAEGANKPCTGFRDQKAIKTHKKHWGEFGVTSNADYEKLAIDFIKQPVGGNIDGYLRERDGAVIRFNVTTGEMGVGIPGREVITYFKAKYENGKVNLTAANNYFNEHKKVEQYEQDSIETSSLPGLQEV